MLCPVCNGLEPLNASCPNCGAGAEDEGRPEDWSGPYAPYELTPRETARLGNGTSVCPHLARCPGCGAHFQVEVGAWHL